MTSKATLVEPKWFIDTETLLVELPAGGLGPGLDSKGGQGGGKTSQE